MVRCVEVAEEEVRGESVVGRRGGGRGRGFGFCGGGHGWFGWRSGLQYDDCTVGR